MGNATEAQKFRLVRLQEASAPIKLWGRTAFSSLDEATHIGWVVRRFQTQRCPQWVICRHSRAIVPTSGFPLGADMAPAGLDVGFGPEADIRMHVIKQYPRVFEPTLRACCLQPCDW